MPMRCIRQACTLNMEPLVHCHLFLLLRSESSPIDVGVMPEDLASVTGCSFFFILRWPCSVRLHSVCMPASESRNRLVSARSISSLRALLAAWLLAVATGCLCYLN